MWIVAWEDANGKQSWEVVNGQDAVNKIIHEIEKFGINLKDIIVGEIPPAFLENI